MKFFKKFFFTYFLQTDYIESLKISSYTEELNKQCLKFLPFINIICLLAWLPYISIDRQIHPQFSTIIFIRYGLTVSGIISMVFFYLKLIPNNMGIKLMIFLGFYVVSATAVITGLSSGVAVYFGGFLFIIMCLILIPIRFYILWSVILTGLGFFLITSYITNFSLKTTYIRYSFSDILAAVFVSLIFSYLVDEIRYKSYLKTLELKKERNQLKYQKDILLKELVLAKKIQQSLIPSKPIAIPGVSVAYIYKPMKDVGGDFFDFITVREPNLFGVFISDVSGHGMPAALITSMVKTLIVTAGENRIKPAGLLKYINEKITDQMDGNFLTAFYGLYNNKTNSFTYAKGAHNAPYLIRNNNITFLESKGRILGIFESVTYEEINIQLETGDRLILFTDGLTEAISPEGVEFEEFLSEVLLKNAHLPVSKMMNNIYSELLIHRNEEEFEDDICIIAIEISKPSQN